MNENRQVDFNSNDWDSINATIEKLKKLGCMMGGKTLDGDLIFFDLKRNDGHDILITSVVQSNEWVRNNYYDPINHTVEESYEKV